MGAIRLFLGSLPSLSPGLASRFVPAVGTLEVPGVSGGVVRGTPVTLPEFVAAMLGTLPIIKDGFVVTGWAADDCVATEEVELDRAGEVGRALTKPAASGGEGAVNELAEFRCWCEGAAGNGEGGANTADGVTIGVLWLDDGVPPDTVGCLAVGISP